jgi:hypothetical protein
MAQDAPLRQGFHAALIRSVSILRRVKHFPPCKREMFQEIRAACVDLP